MNATAYTVPYLPTGSVYGQAEIDALSRLLTSEAKLSCGPERDAFEQEFAAYTGAPHALSLTNCTIALELATYLLDLQPGDEVIAAPQTYQANVTPLLTLPVKVRFCDVDPNSLNASPDSVAELVTERTKAVFLVHHGGMPADMDPLLKTAADSNLTVVEDCAHALGTRYHGRAPGTFGHLGCWSFQSYKNISTLGEGGMLTLTNAEWAHRVDRVRSIEPDARFAPRVEAALGDYPALSDGIERHEKNAYTEDCTRLLHPGTNSTLSEPAAAVGRIQLRRLNEFIARRAEIAQRLDAGLGEIAGIRVQTREKGIESSHHLYTCFLAPETGIDRDAFIQRLDSRGVHIQLRYFPVHLLPEWRRRGHGLGECPVAERIWFREQINLPIYPQLKDWQVDFMIEAVAATMRDFS